VRRFLASKGINNQGNVAPWDPPVITFDDLRFRSVEEVNVYKALLKKGIPFAPLPVVVGTVDNGINRRRTARLEPDFLLLFRHRCVVVEVDGKSHEEETAAEAEERTVYLKERGVTVRYVTGSKCRDEASAAAEVDLLLKSLSREIPTP